MLILNFYFIPSPPNSSPFGNYKFVFYVYWSISSPDLCCCYFSCIIAGIVPAFFFSLKIINY